jgi:hypothetical protein
MTLAEAKECLERVEDRLADEPFVVAWTELRNGRVLHLAVTERLRKRAKKARLWKTPHFLSTLRNAEYGYDESRARSRGGTDGIFLLDRSHRPANVMMHRVFDQYLDREDSGVAEVAAALGTTPDQLLGVRLVSHHLRLLGVLHRAATGDWLVLVDYDDSE